jgi:toxin ParE1/3/4
VTRFSIRIGEEAASDILDQFSWYEAKSGSDLAGRWEKAVSSTFLRIVRHPHSGAPCNFKSRELWGTRRITIAKFPKHLIFYQIKENEVVILRVLHGARDLEALF